MPPPPPAPDPFLEEQVELLAEKVEGLEGELRYAWRALDVLSQEYVKMWQRLEKMEGLLGEQQTVISQLIDLYSADSSDNNADGGMKGSGLVSPGSMDGGGRMMVPGDEDFYKALNAMHGGGEESGGGGDLVGSQSMEDFISPDHHEGDAEMLFAATAAAAAANSAANKHASPKSGGGKQGTFSDFITQYDAPPLQATAEQKKKHRKSRGSSSTTGSTTI